MRVYFDSSILLSILFEENGKDKAEKMWGAASQKVSSLLLDAELRTVLRRSLLKYESRSKSWDAETALMIKESKADGFTRKMQMIPFTADIMEILRDERRLGACRSLDAIHLATALYIRQETGEPLTICSYDTRMRETAQDLGFSVLPTVA